jgi:antitoxin CcdA
MTNNLSEVIESLVSDVIAAERQRRAAETYEVQVIVETWNRFAEKHGSFADQHSTL